MALDDASRFAIERTCTRLVHLYANLNDAHDWETLANLFVTEGMMIRPSAPDQPILGREAILRAFLARAARTTRHISANVVIDVESYDRATGESAMLLFSESAGMLAGSFKDSFIRTEGGWRFKSRIGSISISTKFDISL